MKIYTGSGDRGKTSLFSGERVTKGHVHIEAYGDVDELNSILGWLASILPAGRTALIEKIRRVQSDLFHVGAWLATTPDSAAMADLQPVGGEFCRHLEQAIDVMEEQLQPLTGFILPGGETGAAIAHVARTVCRRAERRVSTLCESYTEAGVPEDYRHILVYLNRLSDYLFVMARYCNHLAGLDDLPWTK